MGAIVWPLPPKLGSIILADWELMDVFSHMLYALMTWIENPGPVPRQRSRRIG